MIYTVILKGAKNHTSEHKVAADSPDDAIDLVLGRVPFDVPTDEFARLSEETKQEHQRLIKEAHEI